MLKFYLLSKIEANKKGKAMSESLKPIWETDFDEIIQVCFNGVSFLLFSTGWGSATVELKTINYRRFIYRAKAGRNTLLNFILRSYKKSQLKILLKIVWKPNFFS